MKQITTIQFPETFQINFRIVVAVKNLFVTLAVLLFTHLSYSQVVSSSCIGSESVNAAYIKSAQRLTMRKFMEENSIYLDSIHIPQSHVDTILAALIAVYNATGLAARDTVVDIYGIAAKNYPTVNGIYVQADTLASWTDSLDNGVIPTGNYYIDSLISAHYLTLTGYYETGINNYGIASFVSDSSYNIFALADAFLAAPMVLGSGLSAFVMDGNDISCTINSDHVELTYSIGWGDCMSGCISHRYWVFKVYYDCSVEYVGSYGAVIYYMDINNDAKEKILFYPNPVQNELNLITGIKINQLTIYSVDGREVFNQKIENQNSVDVSDLPVGVYVVKIISDEGIFTVKILKE